MRGSAVTAYNSINSISVADCETPQKCIKTALAGFLSNTILLQRVSTITESIKTAAETAIEAEIDSGVEPVLSKAAALYVVATPIGNLGDISPRAIEVLCDVAVIAAEDTRHSQRLMQHIGCNTPMMSLHDHNERSRVEQLVARIQRGDSVALISDAGTPLISDPGFQLVRACRAASVRVVPVPGACAAIAALSAAGLPSDRFTFEGFLPSTGAARRKTLQALIDDPRTLLFYESPHRIGTSLQDMADVFGPREACFGRELTKRHESIRSGTLDELAALFANDKEPNKGEFVVMVSGQSKQQNDLDVSADALLKALLAELPPSKAVKVAVKLTGLPRAELYERAQELNDRS